MSYEPIDGPCADCGRADEVCCDHRGRALCQDCWHAAREREQPYIVRRVADRLTWFQGTYLKEEAEARAAEKTAERQAGKDYWRRRAEEEPDSPGGGLWVAKNPTLVTMTDWDRFEAVPCDSWWGNRIAHPGYMARQLRERLQATCRHLVSIDTMPAFCSNCGKEM